MDVVCNILSLSSLRIVSSDSIMNEKCMLTFIDDCTRKVFVFFIKSKESHIVLQYFKRFKAKVENEIRNNRKCLHTDNGGEYMCQVLQGVKGMWD